MSQSACPPGETDAAPSLTEAAFGELMRLYGRERPAFVHFEEGATVLATRFAADEAVSAAIAAGAAVAADLWTLRTGATQTVEVGTREAAAALTGYGFLRFAEPGQAPVRDRSALAAGLLGFHKTADGRHVLLHPSFPPGTERILRALACAAEPEAIEVACQRMTAQEIEDRVASERGCAGVARTSEEWDASEPGRQLAARPPVEVIRIGESEPEPPPAAGDMPLSGARVLDLTRVLAGPTCARTLAQYGAEVLYLASPNLPASHLFVPDTNHGKLSALLDLAQPAGRARLGELLRGADVLSQGYRAGALERMGFGPAQAAAIRPGIVYVSLNCYGHEGPWRARAGWEQLAQTVTGMAHLHGGEQGPKLQPGAVNDYTTGFLAAFGALVALQRRALGGGSYLVRVSLCRTAMWIRGLGVGGEARLRGARPLDEDEIRGFSISSIGGYGPLTHLRPPVRLDATPARWTRPVARLGTHPAAWPEADARFAT